MEFNGHLTEEQQNVAKFALSGHNMVVLGGAGVGKTTVVQAIRKLFTAQGKKCQIVCASSVSCIPYGGIAKTVHAQYGLQTAELPQSLLIGRSLARKDIVEQINATDIVIWDEISMTSPRILETVELLHRKAANNTRAFGGKQIILVGDFAQLKPIVSAIDPGVPIYRSNIFTSCFPHRL